MTREALAKAATDILMAYLSRQRLSAREMGELAQEVCRALNRSVFPETPAAEAPTRWKPAVPVRASVRADALICLVCGAERLTLRRHLGVAHGLSPDRYRDLFKLSEDYPMDAKTYTEVRRSLAKARGLGKRIIWENRPPADPDRRRRRRREAALSRSES